MLGTHDKRVREHKLLIHESPKLMQIQPGKNHERGPSRSVRMAVHHALFVKGRTGSPVTAGSKRQRSNLLN